MSGIEIVLGVVLGLVVNEATDLSPWLGRLFVGWSARLRYGGDTPLGTTRSEELKALIDARPGKLFKLFTGVGFVSSALLFRARRLVRPETAMTDEPATDLSDLAGSHRVLPLEDEPTTVTARYLFPTERYRGEWKRHWIALAKSAGIVLLYIGLSIWAVQLRIKPQYADDLTIWISVVGTLLVLWQFPRWYFDRFTLTNKRLMLVRGVLRRRVDMIPLLRVTDVRYMQSPLGRLLDYGTFENDAASRLRSLHRLQHLPNPNELYLRIVEEMYEPMAVEARLGRFDDDEDESPDETDRTRNLTTSEQLQVLTVSIDALVTAIHALIAHPRPDPGDERPAEDPANT